MHLKTAKKKCLDYDTLFLGEGVSLEGANYFFLSPSLPHIHPASMLKMSTCMERRGGWKQ